LPSLAAGPGDVLYVERYTVVSSFEVVVDAKYVIVLHAEVIAVVIEGNAGVDVVAGVDV